MTQRTITVDGAAWTVSVAGRFTVYELDEFPLLFERVLPDGTREQRLSRFSPLGSRSRVIQLMGQAGCQGAQGCHLLPLVQQGLGVSQPGGDGAQDG